MSNIEELREIARGIGKEKKKTISDKEFNEMLKGIRKDMNETEIMETCSMYDVWELTDEQNKKLVSAMPLHCQEKILSYRKKFMSFIEQFGNETLDEDKRDNLIRLISLVRAGFPFAEFDKDVVDFLLKLLGPKYVEVFGILVNTKNVYELSFYDIQKIINKHK